MADSAGTTGLEKELSETVRESLDVFGKTYVNLIVGTVIAVLLMFLIVTIPPLMFGIYYMAKKAVDGEMIEYKDVFKGFDYFVTSWIMLITAGIPILLGLLLFLLPGMVLILLLQYAIPIAIRDNKGAFDAMKKSINLAKDNLVYSIVFLIAVSILNSIGANIRIGTILTLPLSAIMTTVAVKKIQ